jgi:hypothetical protein
MAEAEERELLLLIPCWTFRTNGSHFLSEFALFCLALHDPLACHRLVLELSRAY